MSMSMIQNAPWAKKAKALLVQIPIVSYVYRPLKLSYVLLKTDSFRFLDYHPPGHYHSPIPDFKQISAGSRESGVQSARECLDIDLREEAQLTLLKDFSRYYADLPFSDKPGEATRYYYQNIWFSYGEAIILYSVMRHSEPRRVIEIGSGFSSAAMLDVNDRFLRDTVHFTFIDPHPDRLLGLLTPRDKEKHVILHKQVQDVPLETFERLSANDILFIDSSHVVKIGSAVNHIMFNILPRLRPGVIVHFHDIFWPFEYPREWFSEGRAWNEAYFLRAFLQYNKAFEITYFNSFMAEHHVDLLRKRMPLCTKEPGSSLWLRKIA
jgi:predicted O-methyltransferase YrrM